MRLRRSRKGRTSTGRRRRQAAPDNGSPAAYRSRRADDALGLGRQAPRDPAAAAQAASPSDSLSRFVLRRFGLIILLIALLISSVNVLSLSSNARVMSLNGSGNSFLHDKSVYETAANQILAGSVWNRNKITVNTEAISQQMLAKFPELSSVSVTLPLFSKRPIVYIQTAQPALVLSTQSGAFVIDSTGKALLRADNVPNLAALKLPTVTDQSNLAISLNRPALSSDNVSFIQTVIAQLAARHFSVSAAVLPAGTSELDVRLAGQPYLVKFNLRSGDARQQAGTFLATQARLQSQHATPSQYIDVRVDGRAYYK